MIKFNNEVVITGGFWDKHNGTVRNYNEPTGEYLVYINVDDKKHSTWIHNQYVSLMEASTSEGDNDEEES